MKTNNVIHSKARGIALTAVMIAAGNITNPALSAERGEADIKYYPAASLCFSPEQDTFVNDKRMKFRFDGAIGNPSVSHSLNIVCPIIKDNANARTGMKVTLTADIQSGSTGDNEFKCRLAARSLDGTSNFTPEVYESRSRNGRAILNFDLKSSLPIGLLDCVLPPAPDFGQSASRGTQILSIMVRENP